MPTIPGYLFLSYKHEEYEFALLLAERLEKAGVHVWMDRRNLKTGDDWSEGIKKALAGCKGLIAIMTPEYLTSRYCPKELGRAYELRVPLFCVIRRPIPTAEMPIQLQNIQSISFTDIHDPRIEQERFDRLLADVRARAAEQIGPPADPLDQYLNSLITDLEKRAGILQYVALETAWMQDDEQPDPRKLDGFNPEFALLDSAPYAAGRVIQTTIEQAVKKNAVFVLTGESGAGKTTTIRHLASDAAKTRRENPVAPIPLFAYLPLWEGEATPLEFLQKFWLLKIDLRTALIKGDVLLYLDGLNEMGVDRPRKTALLREWLRGPEKPMYGIITCRTADYVGELSLNIPEVNCLALNEGQIRKIAENYLEMEQLDRFLKLTLPDSIAASPNGTMIPDARNLFDLARNPYLLAMLIYSFRESKTGTLPKNSGLLFQSLVKTLWERENLHHTPGWVSLVEALPAFAALAYAIIDADKPVDVPIRWAQSRLANMSELDPRRLPARIENLVNVGRSASLLDIRRAGEGQSVVRFYHQMMQEYFAAEEALKKGLLKLLKPPQFADGRRTAQKWDLVVIAACGITPDPDKTVLDIAAKDAFLAAECIASGLDVTASTYSRVYLELGRKLDTKPQMLSAVENNVALSALRAMTLMETSSAGVVSKAHGTSTVVASSPAQPLRTTVLIDDTKPSKPDLPIKVTPETLKNIEHALPTPTLGTKVAKPASPKKTPASVPKISPPTPVPGPEKVASVVQLPMTTIFEGALSPVSTPDKRTGGKQADPGVTKRATADMPTIAPKAATGSTAKRITTELNAAKPESRAKRVGKVRIYLADSRTEANMFARLIADWLDKRGVAVTPAIQVEGKTLSGSLREKIITELEASDVYVLLLNDRTLDSELVRFEISEARRLKLDVIPIFREGADRHKLMLTPSGAALRQYEYVLAQDRSGRFMDATFQQILRLIQGS